MTTRLITVKPSKASWFDEWYVQHGPLCYNSLEDREKLKGNTVGSRSDIELSYIAGFLDGDGSIMLQLKKRSDTSRGYRFMATVCLYQDSRHDTPLHWIRDILGAGYVTTRNDSISELRINGFETVRKALTDLQPFIRFKVLQAEAMIRACQILERGIHNLNEQEIVEVIDMALLIQRENYKAHRKKSREEMLRIFGLTP